MHHKPIGAALVALALGLASCGGSGALSQTELLKQANRICAHARVEFEAVLARAKWSRAGMERAVPIVSRSVHDLRALKPPKRLEAEYARLLVDEQIRLDQFKRALAGQRTQSAERIGHDRLRIIRALGFTACR